MHKLIYRLIRRFHDIYKSFVDFDHEILAAVAIDKRRSCHIEVRFVSRKRHRTHDMSARPYCGIEYLLTTVVDDPAVIRF